MSPIRTYQGTICHRSVAESLGPQPRPAGLCLPRAVTLLAVAGRRF